MKGLPFARVRLEALKSPPKSLLLDLRTEILELAAGVIRLTEAGLQGSILSKTIRPTTIYTSNSFLLVWLLEDLSKIEVREDLLGLQ